MVGRRCCAADLRGQCSFAENVSGPRRSSLLGRDRGSVPATTGKTWSCCDCRGYDAAAASAANGRAVVVWHGGTAAAPVLQASTEATPGGAWSAPVTIGALNVGAQAPLLGIDGSGNAVVAWTGATSAKSLGSIFAASLPAGGTWTAVKALATGGGSVLRLVVNSTGSAIAAWATDNEIIADSGTILGGFAAPVNIGPALGYHDLPRVPFAALNNAGQAVVAYTPQSAIGMAATRSANGTWAGAVSLPCGFAGATAIDGAGDITVLCEGSTINAQGQPVTTLEATRLPAGGSTWSTPALLTSDTVSSASVVADTAGTFVAAWTDLTTVNDMGVEAVDAVTSPPGSGFGATTSFPVTLLDNFDLNIAPGHATLVWNTTPGAFEANEPVS